MRHSEKRILTTHAGSLPRPRELAEMFGRLSRHEPIDAAALESAMLEATRQVVRMQAECGIDVGNDGEQARESFFTYVQHRMTGFGDSWFRPIMADVAKFPGWAVLRASDLAKRQVSLMQLPVCTSEVKPLGTGEVAAECDAFKRALGAFPFEESFMT